MVEPATINAGDAGKPPSRSLLILMFWLIFTIIGVILMAGGMLMKMVFDDMDIGPKIFLAGLFLLVIAVPVCLA